MSASSIASKVHVADVFNTKKQHQQQQPLSVASPSRINESSHPAPLSSNRYHAEDFVTKYRDLPNYYEGEGKSEYSTPVGKYGVARFGEDIGKGFDDFDKVVEVHRPVEAEEVVKVVEEAEEEDGEETVVHHEVEAVKVVVEEAVKIDEKPAQEEAKAEEKPVEEQVEASKVEEKPAEEKPAEEEVRVEEKVEEVKIEEKVEQPVTEEKKEGVKTEEKKEE